MKKNNRMKISRRQIRLFIKESNNKDRGKTALTEAELTEIAPVVAAIGRAIPAIASRMGPMLKKGVSGLKGISKNPKAAEALKGLLQKSKGKMPNLSKAMDKLGLDLDNLDMEKFSSFLNDPPEEASGDLDQLMKSASGQFEKAEECDCPTPEEVKAAMDALGEVKRRRGRMI